MPPALYRTGGVSVDGVVSVQGSLCPWGLCLEGVPVRGSLFVGSLYRGSLSKGSLSKGVSVQGGLCQGDPLPHCGQTDTCEIITLPQTLFAGVKNISLIRSCKYESSNLKFTQ